MILGIIKKNFLRYFSVLLSFVVIVITAQPVTAQRNCGTVEYQQMLQQKNPGYEDRDQFEQWLKKRIDEKNASQPYRVFSLKEPVFQVPVVVHVVHNGEPYGLGSNIPDEQIFSQIEALNEDFRRQNADANQTLTLFQPVAADTEIEFVLAKQDPEGLPTTGIVRILGSKSTWDPRNFSDDKELKSLSYWPAEDYLNIWVTTLSNGLLGYAQLPVSNLEGLEGSSVNRLTDGMVIGHTFFGSSEKYPGADLEAPWDLGRTVTHEMGHFFGLLHIWGDCGCSCDDYVDDTPIQENSTNGCPSSKQSCGSQDMFQNYMDYTDDGCMNIFTALQKERMRVILNSSPRRASLTASHGLNEPVEANLDLGIRDIVEPKDGICTSTLIPFIDIRNYGIELINSAQIQLWVNNALIESRDLSLSLAHLESQNILFNELAVPFSGPASFEFRITEVNGQTDENPANDVLVSDVIIPVFSDIPVFETFETYPLDWVISNEDQDITWELWQTPSRDPANNAMRINLRDYSSLGETDLIISPQVDFSSVSNPVLLFDYAYAFSPGFNNDKFMIALSDDCGEHFNKILFDVKGSSLATAANTSLSFIPSGRPDWHQESINLNQFAGNTGVQIAFIAINGGGNNLYLDNIEIAGQPFTDAGISSLATPGYVFCSEDLNPVLTIENLGTEEINEVEVLYSLNQGVQHSKFFTSLGLNSAEKTNLSLDPIQIPSDQLDLDIEVVTAGDSRADNNQYSVSLFRSCTEEIIPLRENFNDIETEGSNWLIYDKDRDGITWKKNEITQSSVVFENYQGALRGLKDFLFSPVLDLSATTKASLFFDVSYASADNPGELLRIKVSRDLGQTYPDVIYEKSGEELALNKNSAPWIPASEPDWIREFISLDQYAGSQIILAFEATGMMSNNLYIDNLEFYTDDDPDPLIFENILRIYPNPSKGGKFNLTFNLTQKEEVQIMILDPLGNTIFSMIYPNTLNQTYPFDLEGNYDGIYFIKTVGNSFNTSSRIFINP